MKNDCETIVASDDTRSESTNYVNRDGILFHCQLMAFLQLWNKIREN
jgi:hypothetical protein